MGAISGQYRAVVIGGGMLGISTLYHLAREGWKDVLLIEKGEISSGSTWHAAGQCPHFVGSYSLMKIHDYGVKTYANMPKDFGMSAGWHGCGGIRLAYTDEEVSWFKHIQGIARLSDVDFEIIPPEEIARVHPFLNLDGVVMGAQTFTDGHTDPSSGANAFAAGAKALGAKISLRNRALSITRQGDSWCIETEQGTVYAEHVVNAAGSYGDALCAMVGKRAPLSNMVHQYVVTEALDELTERSIELPVIRDPWCNAYLRQEQKGLLIGPYENKGARIVWKEENRPHWDFDMELLPEELERIAPWLEQATERLPLFGRAGIKRVICGAITHTPDGNFLAGPAAGLENFWLATGAGIGIAQGPGVGKYLAQWMIHGEAEINMNAFDPRRFGDWAIGEYTQIKSIDDYEHMYAMHHPDLHREAARPVRVSALDETLRFAGACMTEVHGWERPMHFGGTYGGDSQQVAFYGRNFDFLQQLQEISAVEHSSALFDLSSFATFRISGTDSAAFLDRLTPARLPRKGRSGLCHLLNDNATFLAEWTITRLEEDEFLIFSGAAAEVTDWHLLELAAGKFSGDVRMENVTEKIASLLLTGSTSRELLAPLISADLSTVALPWMAATRTTLADDCPVTVVRMSYAGALGYEIHTETQHLQKVHDALMDSAMRTRKPLFYAGTKALNGLRLEKSFPAYGSELTNEVTFIEAGLERFWDKNKADFRGKTLVEKLIKMPQKQKLVLLSLDEAASDNICADAMGNEPIYANGQRVGITTSGGYGGRVKRSLAFGYISPEAESQSFEVLVQGEMIPATVHPQALYDADYRIIRA